MKEHIEQLENMVDNYGTAWVLAMLSEICFEKAHHIESNWQDKPGAKPYKREAVRLASMATKCKL